MKKHRNAATHAILDPESRKRKAAKISRVLSQHTDLAKSKVLDIGTGAGYIAHHIGKTAKEMTSVDVVDQRRIKHGYKFVPVKDEALPFDDETFDVVISNHVIEHVADHQQHIDEVLRVLTPGGLIYFATPNRYWLFDPHYEVPFINWLPRKLAGKYLRAVKGQTWDIWPTTTRTVRKRLGRKHQVQPIVVDIIKNPEQYHLDTLKPLHPITRRLPRCSLRALSTLSPTILLLITKNR